MISLVRQSKGSFLRNGLLFLVGVFFLLVLSSSFVFKAEADSVVMLPGMHSVTGDALEDSQYVEYEYVWNDFKNEITSDIAVNNIYFEVAWSFSEDGFVKEPETSADTEIDPPQEETAPEIIVPETVDDVPAESAPLEVPPAVPAVEEESVPLEEVPSPEDLPQEVSLDVQTYPLAVGEFEEVVEAPQPLEVAETSEVVVETVSEIPADDESLVSAEVTAPTEVSPEDTQDAMSFELLYSLDGQEWQGFQNGILTSPSKLRFALPQISRDDLSKLQIMLRIKRLTTDERKIYFDGARVEIDAEGVIEEGFLKEESLTVPETEPNFAVGVVKADVQSGNIRAVILERGGLLELWYSQTQTSTGKVAWNKLFSDSSLDSTAPLGIQGRTIFWIDKNQQNIFSFNVDEQSINAESLVNEDSEGSALRFKNGSTGMWYSTFDKETNDFEFSKKPPEQQ